MRVVTLLDLTTSPLPKGNIAGSVFVTIWLFFVVLAAVAFRHVFFGKARTKDPWNQFQNVFFGAIALAIWYILVVVDRWMRYDERQVPAGYILLQPVSEPFRVASSLLILSGIFQVLWRRESNLHNAWWFTNNIMILLVSIVSIFYCLLFLAQAVSWLLFTSLNSIRDIADRRAQFEIAMAAMFMGYSLLVSLLAGHACFQIAKKVDNHKTVDRLIMFGVALLLFARCLMELILAGIVFSPYMQRQDVQLAQDIAYGIITVVALSLLVYLAWKLGPQHESGGHHRRIESNVRVTILEKLKQMTDDGRNLPSPPFSEVLGDVVDDVQKGADNDSLFTSSGMDVIDARTAAVEFIARLKQQEGFRGAVGMGIDGVASLSPPRGRLSKPWAVGSSGRSTESGGPSSIATTRPTNQWRVPVTQTRPQEPVEHIVFGHGPHRSRDVAPPSSVMGGQFSPDSGSIQMEDWSHQRSMAHG